MDAVRIEPWGEGDLPLLEKLTGDPAMMEHLGGPESPEKIAERQARYERADSGMFKIVDVATGEAVGSVGFWPRSWRGEEVNEIGWSVVPAFQGRGIARSGDRSGDRGGPVAERAAAPARLPVGRQRAVERHLPEPRLHAPRGVRVRVPAGPVDAVQRLAPRPLRRRRKVTA